MSHNLAEQQSFVGAALKPLKEDLADCHQLLQSVSLVSQALDFGDIGKHRSMMQRLVLTQMQCQSSGMAAGAVTHTQNPRMFRC